MANRQVISIQTDGSISGLQRKPGEGFDLRKLGHAKIVRASEIMWNDINQKWYVQILVGKYAGRVITPRMCLAVINQEHISEADTRWPAIEFLDYDEAVKTEIAVLDHIRRTEGATVLR